MLRWTDLRMGFQKMVKHMQEGQSVRFIQTLLSPPDVIHDHVPDFFHAMLSLQEILSESSSGDFWQMFMLRDRENLFFGQAR